MICIDGKCDPDAKLDPAQWLGSEGVQFGMGLFETLRAYRTEDEPERVWLEDWEAHIDRLSSSASALGIGLPAVFAEPKKLFSTINPLLQPMKKPVGALKLSVIKAGSGSHWWAQERAYPYTKGQLETGFDLCISKVRRNSSSMVSRHKTLNYAENWLERQKAVENSYQEVLFLNESGFLTEGSVSNLFFIAGGQVYTPGLENGLLGGIMRQRLIEAFRANGQTVAEGNYPLEMLLSADQVLLTNALMGISAVRRIEKKTFKPLDQATKQFIQRTDPVGRLL